MLTIDVRHPMLTSEGPAELNVSQTINPGELVCLFGPSGVGKTTLLRILAGLTKPKSGRIVFGDTVWFDAEQNIFLPPQRRNTGLMFQDYALFPHMTVEKQIRFAQRETDEVAVLELLDLFGLTALAKRKPHQLSGGQKQRVALVRALASKPALLMLDEPLSALDYAMRLSLQEEIRKAHRLLESVTLLVSHDLEEVVTLATSVLVMKPHQKVEQHDPDLFSRQVEKPTFPVFLPTFR
jgi:molybdate transport system ATP-binding protein